MLKRTVDDVSFEEENGFYLGYSLLTSHQRNIQHRHSRAVDKEHNERGTVVTLEGSHRQHTQHPDRDGDASPCDAHGAAVFSRKVLELQLQVHVADAADDVHHEAAQHREVEEDGSAVPPIREVNQQAHAESQKRSRPERHIRRARDLAPQIQSRRQQLGQGGIVHYRASAIQQPNAHGNDGKQRESRSAGCRHAEYQLKSCNQQHRHRHT